MTTDRKLAVLIDADNAQASIAKELLAEIARYGNATVRRAYGDWTTTNLTGWKNVLLDLAIQPIQQFAYTKGKNATDSSLIIDAMDLLHKGDMDGFCIVSSDSDFTRLATRLRESGYAVYGFGEQKTPQPFVAACDKFIYTEILRPEGEADAEPVIKQASGSLKTRLVKAIDDVTQEDGWAPLSTLGTALLSADPAFDARNFGHKKLSDLVRAQNYLEVKSVAAKDGSSGARIYVKVKRK
ncbi:MAG: NYN domain-containing protein [Pseudoxanthomonas sp.]